MYDCKIKTLQEKGIRFEVQTLFGNRFYEGKKNVFGSACKKCPYNNCFGFEKNYFTSTNCCCYSENHQFYCKYCFKLRHSLNYKVKKSLCLRR